MTLFFAQYIPTGLENWKIYLEQLGRGELNNNQDEVELMHVNITRQLDSLIEFVYPDLSRTDPNSVILATLNTTIDTINARIIDAAPGTSTLYRLLSHLSQYDY